MCDTMVALGNATADGSVIFAKNSDRDPNEAQELVIFPRQSHPAGSTVKCTYIEIPQVSETYTVLLSRPFWIWGTEVGANEHGLVIGNEAAFTKVPYGKEPALIGMDFIRLALERAATAREALDVITALLQTYGQGGNCGLRQKLYYHNTFILADPSEAWLLETAGTQWAAEKVRDIRSISNAITIGNNWDLASDGLVDYALERGWCKREEDFHFGKCYSDFLYTRFSYAHQRQQRTSALLQAEKGAITPRTMMTILRDHDAGRDTRWTPARGIFWASVCCHAGPGPVRISQTVGSMVSHLTASTHTHWLTGTSAPCTSVFKPVWIDTGLPDLGPPPTARYDKAALWWRHEALHREVLRDYSTRLPLFDDEREALESVFLSDAEEMVSEPSETRAAFTARCFEQADQALLNWRTRAHETDLKRRLPVYYALAWRKVNREAGIAE